MKLNCAIVLIAILVLTISATPQLAQTQSIGRLVVQLVDEQINLYSADDAGNLAFLITLSDFGIGFDHRSDNWAIWKASDIVVSPDGRHVAFPAISGRNATALYIYTVGHSELRQIDFPGLPAVKWSPTSDAILVVPYYENLFWKRMEDAYLYELATETLTQLPDTPNFVANHGVYRWLPDGERIVYWDRDPFCTTDECIRADELWLIDRNSQSPVPLTNLVTQLATDTNMPFDLVCSIGRMTWSRAQQRLYYVVHCIDSSEFGHDPLYSNDLNEDNRLELDLYPLFPNDRFTEIEAIFTGNNGDVYTVLASNRWRIMHTAQPGQWSLIADGTSPESISPPIVSARMSPNEETVVVNGGIFNGYLATVDLSTGDVAAHPVEQPVCIAEFLDDQTVLYSEFSESCYDGSRMPTGTWRLDLNTGTRSPFIESLDGTVWVLPVPETLFERP